MGRFNSRRFTANDEILSLGQGLKIACKRVVIEYEEDCTGIYPNILTAEDMEGNQIEDNIIDLMNQDDDVNDRIYYLATEHSRDYHEYLADLAANRDMYVMDRSDFR